MGEFRIAALALTTLGVLLAVQSLRFALDPEGARCQQARFLLEDQIDGQDGDTPDAVREALGDLTTEQVKDGEQVSCDDAVATAVAVADADGSVRVVGASTIRTLGFLATATGAVQLVGGFLSVRRQTRQARTIALFGCVFGAALWFALGLGVFAVLIHALLAYGLFYSRSAREQFGNPRGLVGPRSRRPDA